ncbi:MAG: hypothetical protein PHF18_12840 [Methanosarcina sp.]|nr:hypothetical protein [Methanosarcina sp.]MDD3247717.1 hypothetical protein [Methanosarcina sp.]
MKENSVFEGKISGKTGVPKAKNMFENLRRSYCGKKRSLNA